MLLVAACSSTPSIPGATRIDVSVGQVDEQSALVWLWGRAGDALTLRVRHGETLVQTASVTLGTDRSAHVALGQLDANTRYALDVEHKRRVITATFKTAPEAHQAAPLRFLFSGDLAGQNACRDAQRGFAVFDAINQQPADFFIGLGDMIYADGTCGAIGPFGNPQIERDDAPLGDIESFVARWGYNHADPGFQQLRRSMAYVPVWDDHEVVNDFGPNTARLKANPDRDLLAPGRAAFFATNPIRPALDDPNRLYRRFRFGRHAEFFVLDTRQYRDLNETDDTGVLPKSMLGATQRQWLIDGLSGSTATWKFVISSVPVTIPTGWPVTAGRDGWASGDGDDGFERELYAIFKALADASVTNLLMLSGDVHFATGFALQPLPRQPEFRVRELIVGPLSAGMFPTQDMDATFAPERLFFHGLEQQPNTLDEALAGYNFGAIEIDARGELRFDLIDGHGDIRHTIALSPTP